MGWILSKASSSAIISMAMIIKIQEINTRERERDREREWEWEISLLSQLSLSSLLILDGFIFGL
jgi:hypothetical protein